MEGTWAAAGGLTRSVEMSTLHWYCFSLDMASSLWSWVKPPEKKTPYSHITSEQQTQLKCLSGHILQFTNCYRNVKNQ